MVKKLIFYTDVHYSNKAPSSRKDDYQKSIMSKLIEIDKLSREYKADRVICGGDIVHKYNESYSVFNDLYEYFSNTYIKHDLVAGFNHDFSGGNYDVGFRNSILGALKTTNCINEVGQTYETILGDVKFYTSHRSITPVPFFGGTTLYQDLDVDAKVILCSHIHFPYGITEVNGRIFVAPGSISRNSCDIFNINRRPQIALISVSDGEQVDVELIPLNVELDVFDEKYLIKEPTVDKPRSLEHMEQIMDLDGIVDVEDIIRKVGHAFSPGSVEEAIKFKKKVENE